MSTALAHIPFSELEQMGHALAQSGLFGMKQPVQAIALMLVAQAEGQHPATIAQDYDIIQGKATRKTHSVLARFQAAGGKVEWHELSHTKAEATFSHPSGGSVRLDWTIEQARAAKLAGKDNWVSYARAMLRARLIAEGVRAVYPAALGGMMVSEEAQDLAPEQVSPPAGPKHMGDVEVIERAKPALPTQSDEEFAKNMAIWTKVIRLKKKDVAGVLATVATVSTLTEAQIEAIKGIPAKLAAEAQAEPSGPTFQSVSDAIAKAQDEDALNLAADLINSIPEQQREPLNAAYDARRAELNA